MNPNTVLNWLVENAPPIFDREGFAADRCLLATRHGLDVCRYFGIKGGPVKVGAIVGNAAWVEWMETSPTESDMMPDEAWSIGVDLHSETPGKYAGHLVLMVNVESDRFLLDLSLGQMSRPHRDINLPAAGLFLFPSDDDIASYSMNGTYLYYQLRPERDWLAAKDWKKKPPFAGEMIRAIRGLLPYPTTTPKEEV
jgi:hypothetical protein